MMSEILLYARARLLVIDCKTPNLVRKKLLMKHLLTALSDFATSKLGRGIIVGCSYCCLG